MSSNSKLSDSDRYNTIDVLIYINSYYSRTDIDFYQIPSGLISQKYNNIISDLNLNKNFLDLFDSLLGSFIFYKEEQRRVQGCATRFFKHLFETNNVNIEHRFFIICLSHLITQIKKSLSESEIKTRTVELIQTAINLHQAILNHETTLQVSKQSVDSLINEIDTQIKNISGKNTFDGLIVSLMAVKSTILQEEADSFGRNFLNAIAFLDDSQNTSPLSYIRYFKTLFFQVFNTQSNPEKTSSLN
jgi:hypothetical protein